MKNIFNKTITLLLIISLLFSFTACIEKDNAVKNITLYLVNGENVTEYCFKSKAADLGMLIDEHKTDLKAEWTESSMGKYLTAIGGWNIKSDSQYISILVSFNKIEGNYIIFTDPSSAYNTHYEAKNGAKCDSSTVGASSLPLVDGETYVLILLSF
ncbi:MAG: hypothetical protein RR054_05605 [Clostridia bacterium]